MKNSATAQGILSIAALICLLAGWFKIFPADVSDFLYNKLFYVLAGLTFIISAQTYPSQTHRTIAYVAAAFSIIGPFLPGQMEMAKTVGLLAGVALTFFARPRRA